MKDKFLHIFINLINRKHDKFFGIKKQLLTKDNHHCRDIKLSEKSMNLFMSVEYGNKKYFRELYYSSVFRELEKKLIKSVNNNNNNNNFIIIYLQDEGVWSEFLRHLIQKYNLNHIYFVNVQHGFLMKNEPSLFRNKIINFINSIYNLLFGFPKFGIGPFNGLFNYYLLFHEELCSEVPNASKAIHCPNLINRSFIDSYQLETSNTTVIQKSVLIALQHNPLFGFYSITFEQSLKTLIPLIESLKERFGYDIFLRKHPGMNNITFIKTLKKTGLYNKVLIDKESVVSSIKRSPFVFSFNSTILFESSLVDRIPIIINNHSFSLSGFPVKYNMIDLKEDLEIQLKNIFQLQKQSNDSRDEINWVKLIEEELTNE